jgi:hypothetical protein
MDKGYRRRWQVRLRGQVLGTVLAATHRAACLRAIERFKVSPEDRHDLEVERLVVNGQAEGVT